MRVNKYVLTGTVSATGCITVCRSEFVRGTFALNGCVRAL